MKKKQKIQKLEDQLRVSCRETEEYREANEALQTGVCCLSDDRLRIQQERDELELELDESQTQVFVLHLLFLEAIKMLRSHGADIPDAFKDIEDQPFSEPFGYEIQFLNKEESDLVAELPIVPEGSELEKLRQKTEAIDIRADDMAANIQSLDETVDGLLLRQQRRIGELEQEVRALKESTMDVTPLVSDEAVGDDIADAVEREHPDPPTEPSPYVL